MRDVAAFYFTALHDSYASRTGRPGNVGVIGVAVYREYVEPPPRAQLEAPAMVKSEAAGRLSANSAEAAPSANAARREMAEKELGTGHGERMYAPTRYTEFRRASSTPSEVIAIYYDSRRNLIAQGVIPRYARLPQPFPNGGFVPDPS